MSEYITVFFNLSCDSITRDIMVIIKNLPARFYLFKSFT